jgi:hypothetical protein
MFEVELIFEGNGHFLNFDYDYEEFGLTQAEAEELASDIEGGRDQGFYDEIMNNISIVPRLIRITDVEDDE